MAKRKPTPASWKPGQSGNPRGREPGPALVTQALRNCLAATTLNGEPNPEGKTNAEMIAEAAVTFARAGNERHLVEILDRTEGRVDPAQTERERFDDTWEMHVALRTITQVRASLDAAEAAGIIDAHSGLDKILDAALGSPKALSGKLKIATPEANGEPTPDPPQRGGSPAS
jgi:hypothetical protein